MRLTSSGIFTILLVLSVSIQPALSDEDELVSISLPSACKPTTGCVPCEDKAVKECHETGFTRQFSCEEEIEGLKQTIFRYESCVPPLEGWVEMIRFDILMFVGAVLSLIYVRNRKQLARNNLVNLVNRS